MFIFIGFSIGVLYVLGTPPYYMLDEPNHFFRAYQISDGSVIPLKVADKTGGHVPHSIVSSIYVFRFGVQQYDEGNVPVDLIRGSLFVPLNEADTTFVAFSNTALYSPFPYIPQVIGIWIGRTFDLSPLVLMYLGRLSNLLFALMFLAAAMHILPVLRWVMFLIVLSPASMFQVASLSADSMLISMTFLFIAVVFRAAYGIDRSSNLSNGRKVILVAITIGTALCKSVYIFLPLLIFLIPAERFGGRFRLAAFAAGLIIVHVGTAGFWALAIRDVYTPFLNPAVNPTLAAEWVLRNPVQTAGILIADLIQHGWFYLHGMVGYQWNQTQVLLPDVFSAAYLAVILITSVLSGDQFIKLGIRRRALLVVFAIFSISFVLFGVYLTWMPPGSGYLEGVQGRYFIPILLPIVFLAYSRKFAIRAVENTLAIILPILSFVSLMYALVMFHRLF